MFGIPGNHFEDDFCAVLGLAAKPNMENEFPYQENNYDEFDKKIKSWKNFQACYL